MARIRSIHPGAPLDEDVASMSLAARYVWAYLPCHADREGRLKDSAFTLKAAIFPGEAIDMEAVLAELAGREHIIRYQVGGKRYIQIRTFAKYQAPHTREVPSTIPAMSGKPGAEHGEGSARPGAEPAGVSPSPSSPDLDLDPISSESNGVGPRAHTRSNSGATATQIPIDPIAPELRRWKAEEWHQAYRLAWMTYSGTTSYGGRPNEWRGIVDLDETLGRLSLEDALRAQARAQQILAEFFTDDTVAPGHPWSWFVQRFEALRVSRGPARGPRKRTVTDGNVEALSDWHPPEVKSA